MKHQTIIFSVICLFSQGLRASEMFRVSGVRSCSDIFGIVSPNKDVKKEIDRVESGDIHKLFKITSRVQGDLDYIFSSTAKGDTFSLEDLAEVSSDMQFFMKTGIPTEVGHEQLKLLHEAMNLQRILLLYLVEFDLKLEINKNHGIALTQLIRFVTGQDELLVMDSEDHSSADAVVKKLTDKCSLAPSLLNVVKEYRSWCRQRNIPVMAEFSTYLKNLESVFCSRS